MYLQNDTKKILEKFIGKSIYELSQMDLIDEVSFIKLKPVKDLFFLKM